MSKAQPPVPLPAPAPEGAADPAVSRAGAGPRTNAQQDASRDAILESEEQFRHLVAGVEDYAIFLLDREGSVATWNAGAERIKGYRAEEILGKNFSIFYPPADVAQGKPQRELQIAAAEGRFAEEGWRIRNDGSQFWASVALTALRGAGGALLAYLKITRDLSERRRAEESLRASEEHFRLLVQDVEDYAIFMLTPEGRVASWNLGAKRIKGYDESEILGRHFSCFYTPEAVVQGKPEWMLEKALEFGHVEDEEWRLRKDGRKFWANVIITALHDAQGTLRGFAKVTRDLTERRKVEELEESDRQKNRFLALLAHELRNPLTPIRSALQVMRQPEASAEALAQARTIAERQVGNMAHLLDDLLDLSRISEGRIELRKRILDVREVVRSAVNSVDPLLVARRQHLTVDLPEGPCRVDADSVRLEQVLTNLLHNASKYTDPEGKIDLRVEAAGDSVVLRLKDNGIGIDPVVLPRIFEIFIQGERRMERAAGGVGIGLTVVKKLVQLHGGSVEALSAGPGRGSEFVVRLPRAQGVSEEPAAAKAPTVRGPGLRVLVVDDNPDSADGLALLLKIQGHTVEVAYDGAHALAAAEKFLPDAVLLDIGMPDLDGHEVARRLRLLPATKGAKLIAITGWGQAEDHRNSRDAGFDHHLVKPVQPGVIEQLLTEHAAKLS